MKAVFGFGAPPVGEKVNSRDKTGDLTTLSHLVGCVVAVGEGVGEGGAEHGFEEVGRQETAFATKTQVRRQNVLSDIRAERSSQNATPQPTLVQQHGAYIRFRLDKNKHLMTSYRHKNVKVIFYGVWFVL